MMLPLIIVALFLLCRELIYIAPFLFIYTLILVFNMYQSQLRENLLMGFVTSNKKEQEKVENQSPFGMLYLRQWFLKSFGFDHIKNIRERLIFSICTIVLTITFIILTILFLILVSCIFFPIQSTYFISIFKKIQSK